MVRPVRVVVNEPGIGRLLRSGPMEDDILRRAEAIRDACNDESTWGGYIVEDDFDEGIPAQAAVIDTANPSGPSRDNRILRNLDAGSD